MSPIDVVLDAPGRWSEPVRATLGSLPRSFAVVPDAPADGRPWVAALDGGSGWAVRALEIAARGPACVVLLHPELQDPASLAGLLRVGRAPFVVQTHWSGSPGAAALASVGGDGRTLPAGLRVLDSRLVVPVGSHLGATFAGQLALLRACVGPVAHVRGVSWGAWGYCARVVLADGTAATASAVISDAEAPSARLLAVGAAAVLEASAPWWTSAAPAVVTRLDARGATTAPEVYESAARATWRRVRDLVAGEQPGDDLAGWIDDQAAAFAVASTRGSVTS